MFNSILVLESPWRLDEINSYSVWPFVSEFGRVVGIDHYYQTFFDVNSFRHWLGLFDTNKGISTPKLLYVASHGTKGRIGTLQQDINKETIFRLLRKTKSINFVHFGSCLFGKEDNLLSLLKKAKHITWAAGYAKEVEWVQSTLFDILIWNRLIMKESSEQGRNFHTLVKDLIENNNGLVESLCFRFAYRYGNRTYCLPKK